MYIFDYYLKNKTNFFLLQIFSAISRLVESMTRIKKETNWFHFTLFTPFFFPLTPVRSTYASLAFFISVLKILLYLRSAPFFIFSSFSFVLLRTFRFYFAKRNRFLLFSDADIDCPYFFFILLFVVLKDIRSDRLLFEQKIEWVLVLHQMRNRLRFRCWNISSEFLPFFLSGFDICIYIAFKFHRIDVLFT